MTDWQTKLPPKPPFEPTGASDSAVAAHVAQANPHTGYLRSVVAGANVTVDSTDPQNPVVAASGGGGSAFDPETTARFFDECFQTAAGFNWNIDTASGSVTNNQDVASLNGVYALASGASSGQRAAIIHAGYFCEPGGGEIRSYFKVKPQHLPAAGQQSNYHVGLRAGTAGTGAGDMIQAIATDSVGGWRLQISVGGAVTTGANVAPIVAGVIQEIEIDVAADGLSASLTIDGVLLETMAVPAGITTLHPYLMSRKGGANGGGSTLWVDKVLVDQDR